MFRLIRAVLNTHKLPAPAFASHFFLALFIISITYRFIFIVELAKIPIQVASAPIILLGVLDDVTTSSSIAVLLYICQCILRPCWLALPRIQKIGAALRQTIAYAVLLSIAVLYLAYEKIFCSLAIGATYQLVANAWKLGFTPQAYLQFVTSTDVAFLLYATAVYFVIQALLSPITLRRLTISVISISLLILAYALVSINQLGNNPYNFKMLYANPLSYALIDACSPTRPQLATPFTRPSAKQMHSLQFIDPLFATSHPALASAHRQRPHPPWNVVVFVLESVGAAYLMPAVSQPQPMPFLMQLKQHGLWLANNYTGGNITALGGFSLLTGLYPSPRPSSLEMQADIHTPTLATWLGTRYDSYFVMASDANYFFQRKLIENTGFKHLYDSRSIKPSLKQGQRDLTDEPDAIAFFLQQLAHSHSPFLAVYWSNATHYPYQDYGKPTRLYADIKQPYDRYYNNLRVLDKEIKAVYFTLKKNGLLNNTILVVVADHGEGFGQHTDEWIHGTALYQEQIQVPVLFYQPRLFKPHLEKKVTSSVDILPTLLQAMHVPYNPQRLQGEDVQQKQYLNKYVFVYGYEDALAAINPLNQKMQISFKDETCTHYDLTRDPHENHPQTCQNQVQQAAMLAFHNYQPTILQCYNKLSVQQAADQIVPAISSHASLSNCGNRNAAA